MAIVFIVKLQQRPSLRSFRYRLRPRHSNSQREVTVVTAYFPLAKAKHSQSNYLEWLENLFSFCQSPMIIFTSAEFSPILHRLRRNGSLPSFFIVDYSSPLQMPPIRSLVSTFVEQHSVDPERAHHSIELYAIWCAKSFMLNRSVELNPFRAKYFLYDDAGAFRSSNYQFQAWPDELSLTDILRDDRFFLGMIAPLPRRFYPLNYTLAAGPIVFDLIEGTFMAGSIRAISWWTSTFYETIDDYRRRNFFIGKDQSVMNAIALSNAHLLNMLLPFRTACGDVWFTFGPLLAEQSEREQFSYSRRCQQQHLSEIVIPFESVCKDSRNLL